MQGRRCTGGSSTAQRRVQRTRGGGSGRGKEEMREPLFKETKPENLPRAPTVTVFFLGLPAPLLPAFIPSPSCSPPPPHVRICPQERYHRLPTICPPWPCPGWRMLIACASCPAHQRNSRSRNPGHMQVDLLTQPENILAVREHLPRVDVRSTAPRPYRAPADLWGPPARVLAGFTHPCAPPNPRTPRTAGTPGEGNQLSTPSNSVSRNRKNS